MLFSLPWYLQFFILFFYYSARAFVIAGLFFYLLSLKLGLKRKITPGKPKPEQFKFELVQTLKIFIFDSLILVAFLKLGLFKVVHLGALADVISFLLLFIWVEITFYTYHRILHRKRFWNLHATHHKAKIPTPLSGFTFSFAERTILFVNAMSLVAIANFVGHPLSMIGIQTYFGLNAFLTVMGHSDLRIYPVSWQKMPLLKYISDPSDHSLHHSRISCNYGLFTNFLDKKLNTYRAPKI